MATNKQPIQTHTDSIHTGQVIPDVETTARNKSTARTANSVTCAHLRTTIRINRIVWGEIPGFNQYKMGRMNRDVCSADIKSVEPRKTTPTQISNGSQYLRKCRSRFVGRLCQTPINVSNAN